MPFYKATFNWYGEVHKMSGPAPHSLAAFRKFTTVLAKKLGRRSAANVRGYFSGSKDNYEIREEVQDEQAEATCNTRRSGR
jgi:hypothetical protein